MSVNCRFLIQSLEICTPCAAFLTGKSYCRSRWSNIFSPTREDIHITDSGGRWDREEEGSLPGREVLFCSIGGKKRNQQQPSNHLLPVELSRWLRWMCVCRSTEGSWSKAAELRLMSPGQGGASPGHISIRAWCHVVTQSNETRRIL